MALDVKRFVARFVEEARDHLQRIGDGLGRLEGASADREVINAVFRSAHTIKGSARMLKLGAISDTAHQVEDVLGALRDGTLTFSSDLGRLLQRGVDAIAAQVDDVADGRPLGAADPALCAALAGSLGGAPAAEPVSPTSQVSPVSPGSAASPASPVASSSLPAGEPAPGAHPRTGAADSGTVQEAVALDGGRAGAPVAAASQPGGGAVGGAGQGSPPDGSSPPEPAPSLVPVPVTDPGPDPGRPQASAATEATGPAAARQGADDVPAPARLKTAETVRVQLDRLDDLIKLMGEVVSSHARLRQRLVDVQDLLRGGGEREPSGSGIPESGLRTFSRHLRDDVFHQELLMEDLHAKALTMRMLPLAIVFEPAARMVRDLGRSVGKDIECVVTGADIELDRQLIDSLSDPIVHMLRNAVDHGIEPSDVRVAAGKPRHGRLSLSARQDGGFAVIEVADDGGGLPVVLIRDKAVRKGLLSAEQAAQLPEAEVVDLIFQPGFSTSPIITDLSGRGVGMDVVKRCVVDDLHGSIVVETCAGSGTTFTLRLPLSLAVMRVMLVAAGGQILGFTAQSIARVVEIAEDRVVRVAERDVVVIHNEFVPMADLGDLLGLPAGGGATAALSGPPVSDPPASGPPVSGRSGRRWHGGHLMVVVRVRNEKLAVRVDDIVDERDMVIKPLPAHLRHLPLVSGMVVTGHDALVAVLQAPGLVDAARRARGRRAGSAAGADEVASPATTSGSGGAVRVLVVDDSFNTREIEKEVLEAHGYEVVLAEDGLDGLRKARNDTYDAVLTDVEMPNMDGFTLTATLRKMDQYEHTPIIIVTSREKEADKRRGIQVGADAYIVKGDFGQGSLVDTLRSLLG